jgi:hypothetical protein
MSSENDMDDVLVRASEVWGFGAAVVLMSRGVVARPPENRRISYHRWVKQRVPRALWQATLREVKAMQPEQIGAIMRPFFKDYDA